MSKFTVLNIRRALLKDLDTITEIYNEAILHTVATLDTEPKTAKNQKLWFTEHDNIHALLVAEQNGQIMGWASLNGLIDVLTQAQQRSHCTGRKSIKEKV